MRFLNPWAIYLGFLAIPVVVAFLISRHRKQQLVPSALIYRRLAASRSARRRFASPQHLVALLLTLLALLALITALLSPHSDAVKPARYIIIVDVSASMGAVETDQEGSRLERAVASVGAFAEGLNTFDEVALITASSEAILEVGWTRQHTALIEALERTSVRGVGSSWPEAFGIADTMCHAERGSDEDSERVTEIILVSDGAGVSVPEIGCPLRYVRVGEMARNLAVTGLSVREADTLGLNEVYLAVHNADDAPRAATVSLEIDGLLVDVIELALPPHTTVEQLRVLPLPGGEVLSATVSGPGEDSLGVDDVGFTVLRPGVRVRTLLVTEYRRSFLVEALRLHDRVELEVLSPDDLATEASADPPIRRDDVDLLVLDAPVQGDLPGGRHMLVLDAEAARLGLHTSGRIRHPELIRWHFDDPLFRFVDLDGLHIDSALATDLPEGATSLADMPEGPLIFSMTHEGADTLYFTFDPAQSDLELRVAFVNLIANIVEWAQPVDRGWAQRNIGVGERLTNPTSGVSITPRAHPGHLNTSPPAGGRRLSEAVTSAGVYEVVDDDDQPVGLVAANLFSSAEAELASPPLLGVGAAHGWPETVSPSSFPWWILAFAGLGLLVLEWILPGLLGLATRRPVVGSARAGNELTPRPESGDGDGPRLAPQRTR